MLISHLWRILYILFLISGNFTIKNGYMVIVIIIAYIALKIAIILKRYKSKINFVIYKKRFTSSIEKQTNK